MDKITTLLQNISELIEIASFGNVKPIVSNLLTELHNNIEFETEMLDQPTEKTIEYVENFLEYARDMAGGILEIINPSYTNDKGVLTQILGLTL
ncbi:hypothetical protein [Elizabethkingia anophelis]|uniref:hypothetical protein n=1 Tax=Elizabethkingia anophelis TaxID=1117645 RepID=UPI0002437A9B|nr:hypothetical protein [Elizabethkingia anophelis]ATC39620.1 hypothetical protein EAAG1_007040 [Elizabethkingia anophelis Ag1]ATC43299.1 hypothetical protein CMV41_07040 [Elizabethkingia anophelis]ATC46975.1 hypothetical protein CMV40_07040 [Elizabethkingia anophelis]MCQ0429361.1 hypothetical protein [Elizabethkingia anophelis]